jgi:hypothetical protein
VPKEVEASPVEEASSVEESTESPAAADNDSQVTPTLVPPPARFPRVRVDARASFAVGLTPGLALGGEGGVRIDLHSRFAMRVAGLGLRGFPAQLGGGEVTLALLGGRLSLCTGGEVSRVDLRACTGAMGGLMVVEGEGYERDVIAAPAYVAATASGHLETPLTSRFAFVTSLEGAVPLLGVRPSVADPSTGTLNASLDLPPVAGLMTLGVLLRFD